MPETTFLKFTADTKGSSCAKGVMHIFIASFLMELFVYAPFRVLFLLYAKKE